MTDRANEDADDAGEPFGDWTQGAAELKAALDEHSIVAISDPSGRIIYVNDNFCALSKYARAELLGQNHRLLNSGIHPLSFFEEFYHTIERGRVWHGETRNRAKDGSLYWLAMTVVPILDERGEPRQYIAISAEITAQKRVEAELAEKLRLQGLLARISGSLVALPAERVDEALGQIQRMIAETLNLDRCTLWLHAEAGAAMLCAHIWQQSDSFPKIPVGYSTEGNLPWLYAKLIRGELLCFSSLEELPPAAARDVDSFRQFATKSNLTIPLSENQEVFGALTFATLHEERHWRSEEMEELKLVAQIVGNVLARRRSEVREEQLRNELAHTMRVASLGELAAAIAHELKQPLTAILSNAQAAGRFLADKAIDSEEFRSILDDIARDDKRAGHIIQNLSAMVSKRPAVREWCSLNLLVREVLDLLKGELILARIEVRLQLAPNLPKVQAACVELQQVLVNLLMNAMHAMEETPAPERFIDIASDAAPNGIVVTVRDRGHGIPPQRLSNIFDPFYSTKAFGLGMGLSICRRIMNNHGGHIEGANQVGGGACFSLFLPAAPAAV